MHSGKLVFAQLMDYFPRHEFNTCVRRYRGDQRHRGFSCRDQFLCLAFGQLSFRESLRDIETCLRAMSGKLYHAGFRGRISRSTLADANLAHDWRIFADFAQVLIARARALYAEDDFGMNLQQSAYALDSTTIDLCLHLFPWARFRRRKGAVKLHTLLDLRGNIPCFIRITHGKTHDVMALDHLLLEPGAFYVMDKGYVDFARLNRFTRCAAFFITRAKKNIDYTRRTAHRIDKESGVRSDHTIVLRGPKTSRLYPESLRRITYYDMENNRRFTFLTNNFTLPALSIAQLYRCRLLSSIAVAGKSKSARQTAHQARACINSPLEIKVSAGALLRLTEWIRQRAESSKFAVKTEQGGFKCEIVFPPAPNEGSGEIELCIVGDGDNHGDGAAGAALDADAVHSAARNAAATDSDAGSTAGGPRRSSGSKSAEHNRSRRNSPRKGGLR